MNGYVINLNIEYDLNWFSNFVKINSHNFIRSDYSAYLFSIYRPEGKSPIKWTDDNIKKYKGIFEVYNNLKKIGINLENNLCYFGKMMPGDYIAEHIDPNRDGNFILPINGQCEVQYRNDYDLKKYEGYGGSITLDKPNENLPIKIQYKGPSIINAKIPHAVVNNSNEERIVFYWSIKKKFNELIRNKT